MRTFCDNPKCEHHVRVKEELFDRGFLFVDRGYGGKKEIKRHDYAIPTPTGYATLSICDQCKSAYDFMTSEVITTIKMKKEAINEQIYTKVF